MMRCIECKFVPWHVFGGMYQYIERVYRYFGTKAFLWYKLLVVLQDNVTDSFDLIWLWEQLVILTDNNNITICTWELHGRG